MTTLRPEGVWYCTESSVYRKQFISYGQHTLHNDSMVYNDIHGLFGVCLIEIWIRIYWGSTISDPYSKRLGGLSFAQLVMAVANVGSIIDWHTQTWQSMLISLCCLACVCVCVSIHQHETIEQLLERGEKLDDLVQKTDKLSGTSKAFYKEVIVH